MKQVICGSNRTGRIIVLYVEQISNGLAFFFRNLTASAFLIVLDVWHNMMVEQHERNVRKCVMTDSDCGLETIFSLVDRSDRPNSDNNVQQ
jgi:hypothetical protein